MEYLIVYEADKEYILITLEGAINVRSMREAINQAGKVILEHHCNKIIGDFRKSTFPVNVIEVMDLYKYWVNSLESNLLSPYEAKRVILMDKNQKTSQNFEFFETVSVNRNCRVKIFFNMDEAINWLTEK
jgi:hypothetical protein